MLAERMPGSGILVVALVGVLVACEPRTEEQRQDEELAALARDLLSQGRSSQASLVLLEVRQLEKVPGGVALLNQVLEAPLYYPLSAPGGVHEVCTEHGVTSFSPDDRRLVAACHNKTARVWDVFKNAEVTALEGHKDVILAASFSPNGAQIVTASMDHTARIWDAYSGAELLSLIGHTGALTVAAYSADGHQILTASEDQTARLWDAEEGTVIATLRGHRGGVRVASFSPDGHRIVTASEDGAVRLWDTEAGTSIATPGGHKEGVWGASFSPDGQRVVTASADGMLCLWDALSGAELATLDKHNGPVVAVSFNSSGTRILSASQDKSARIWKKYPDETSNPASLLVHGEGVPEEPKKWDTTPDYVETLAGNSGPLVAAWFNPDSKRAFTLSEDGTLSSWDAQNGRLLWVWSEPPRDLVSAVSSSEGLTVAAQRSNGAVDIWNLATGAEMVTLRHLKRISEASFNHDGSQVATASHDKTAILWDAETGEKLTTLKGHEGVVFTARFEPAGAKVARQLEDSQAHVLTASGDKTARIWNAQQGREVLVLDGHEDVVLGAAYSSDGTRVLSASTDKTARIWNAESGELLKCYPHSEPVTEALFHPTNKTRILTTSRDRNIRLWDVNMADVVKYGNNRNEITVAVFDPEGQWVMTASADKAFLWEADKPRRGVPIPQRAKKTFSGHEGKIRNATFSHDGKFLVTASEDKSARIWNVATGELTVELRGHEKTVRAASFSFDNKWVTTASEDGTIRIWCTETGKEVAIFGGKTARLTAATFNPLGTKILATGEDHIARLWPWAKPERLAKYLQSRTRARMPRCFNSEEWENIRGGEKAQLNGTAGEQACRSCVSRFMNALGDARPYQLEHYLQAWNIYERCIAERRTTMD